MRERGWEVEGGRGRRGGLGWGSATARLQASRKMHTDHDHSIIQFIFRPNALNCHNNVHALQKR